jgi:hypothetical protein
VGIDRVFGGWVSVVGIWLGLADGHPVTFFFEMVSGERIKRF